MCVLIAGNGMCCTTHACDGCRRTQYTSAAYLVFHSLLMWGEATFGHVAWSSLHLMHLESDPLHDWQTWHWTLHRMTTNDLDDLFFACCVQTLTFPPSLLSLFQSWTVLRSHNTCRLEHASLPMLYSLVCLSSCGDLIHSCIGSPALTVADHVMSHHQKNVSKNLQ